MGIGGIPITRPSRKDALGVIRHALDLGVNFIDTAIGYSDSEERIGEAVEGCREDVVIATKTPAEDGKKASEHLEVSLRRLRTDYIDIWQLHGVSDAEGYEAVVAPGGALEAARHAKEEGRVRHIGLTSHSPDIALRALESGLFETIQFPFSFISNIAEERMVSLARSHDVGFIAMKPFDGGRLEDASLALGYLLQFDNVVPIPGIEKKEEIEEIVALVEGGYRLSQEDLTRIEETRSRVGSRFCRRCQYCLPCAQEVYIPGLMTLDTLWKLWPVEFFLQWNYVKYCVDSHRKCTQCGECETKCPYKLPIREIIQKNMEGYAEVARNHMLQGG